MSAEFIPAPEDDTPRACCVHLRCKSMLYRPDERPGLLHNEEAMGYWCERTRVEFGPDEGLARHTACQPGRACHQAGPPPLGTAANIA